MGVGQDHKFSGRGGAGLARLGLAQADDVDVPGMPVRKCGFPPIWKLGRVQDHHFLSHPLTSARELGGSDLQWLGHVVLARDAT